MDGYCDLEQLKLTMHQDTFVVYYQHCAKIESSTMNKISQDVPEVNCSGGLMHSCDQIWLWLHTFRSRN